MNSKVASVLWTVVLAVAAAPVFAQQGSLTLKDSDLELCHRNERLWDITKTGVYENGKVTFTVTVTKGGVTPTTLSAFGFVRILNSGSADATLGNIVVNLQRKQGKKWATAESDIANATAGDAATHALIVSGASSEGKSSFTEGPAAGQLVFTDADSNSLFSLLPQFSLPAGEALDLLFHADFNNSILNIPAGEEVRFEVIVTFGNAGTRGNGGASGSGIDIDGSGVVEADEAHVRSVPTRLTRVVPEREECASTVTLRDTADQVVGVGVTVSNFITNIGGGTGIQELSDSGVFTVSVTVVPGVSDGAVTNTASIESPGDEIVLEGPIDLLTGLPTYSYEVECCPAFYDEASATVPVPGSNPNEDPPFLGAYYTLSKGGWGNPSSLIWDGDDLNTIPDFSDVYGVAGVEVGIPGHFSMTFSSATAVANYLPGGGTPSCLTENLSNPTSSASGNLGAQILALRLAVDFSDKGITPGGFGDLVLDGTGTSLDTLTVRQVLDVANIALGGGILPPDYGYSDLNGLVEKLNLSFDEGELSSWAQAHLSEDEGT